MTSTATTKINCNICCNDVNQKVILTCNSCDTVYCIKCSKTYLLTVFDAHCMGCKKHWDDRFIRDSFPKTWVNGEYKQHIKRMLLEREKSYIPITMDRVNRIVIWSRQKADAGRAQVENLRHRATMLEIENQINALKSRNMVSNAAEIDRLTRCIVKAKRITVQFDDHVLTDEMNQMSVSENNDKKCPMDGCKGYLKRNICMVCEKHICGKCNLEKSEVHECKQEDIETYNLILKDSKPCPKCATRISKISGCPQMYCISCKAVWDWDTGKIQEKGVIHNPEYFRYMRERGLPLPRQEDVIAQHQRLGCVDFTNFFRRDTKYTINVNHDFNGVMNCKTFNVEIFTYELYRFLNHLRNHLQQTTPREYSDQTFVERRVEYILNNITEQAFVDGIIKQYKQNQYRAMIYNLQEIFREVIVDFFDKVDFSISKGRENAIIIELELTREFSALFDFIKYYNNQVSEISSLFGYKSPDCFFTINYDRRNYQMSIDSKSA